MLFQSAIKRRAQEDEDHMTLQKTQLRQIKQMVGNLPDADTTGARVRSCTTAATIIPTQSEPDLSMIHNKKYNLRGNHQRAMTAYTNSLQKTRPKTPPPVKPVSSSLKAVQYSAAA